MRTSLSCRRACIQPGSAISIHQNMTVLLRTCSAYFFCVNARGLVHELGPHMHFDVCLSCHGASIITRPCYPFLTQSLMKTALVTSMLLPDHSPWKRDSNSLGIIHNGRTACPWPRQACDIGVQSLLHIWAIEVDFYLIVHTGIIWAILACKKTYQMTHLKVELKEHLNVKDGTCQSHCIAAFKQAGPPSCLQPMLSEAYACQQWCM